LKDDRRCLVVDGHAVTRIGVREVLGPEFVVEEAADSREALETQTCTGSFDVAVVELDGSRKDGEPAGPALIKSLHRAMPGTGIVALSRSAERHTAREAMRAGASAFVAKTSPPDILLEAVEAAADAGSFVDPAANGKTSGLTRRQQQTLQLFAEGHSTADVATRLHLSAETVRAHTKALLSRLGARNRAHAVAIAMRIGLVD
jgi:DNA-binding NarL/FixJ family response regulator